MLRAATVMAALGATVGTALDAIHTHFGITAYTHPVFWKAAWWVPLLYAGAYMIGLLRPLLDRRSPPPPWRSVLLAFAIFVAAYVASALPLSWPLVSAILLALFLLSWSLFDRSRVQLVIAAAAAVGGPATEAFFISRGTFVHLQPLVLGVPGWLPFIYMTASVALCLLAKRLATR